MAVFTLTLTEGLNAVSIPLLLKGDAARWSAILEGIAYNSIRTITDGKWQDCIRGRSSILNDFETADSNKGYLIDVLRLGATPQVDVLLPNTSVLKNVEYGQSVYSDRDSLLLESPIQHTGVLWIQTTSTDATNTNASYLTGSVDRAINLYVGYDAAATILPSWLDSWEDINKQIKTDTGTYNIFRLPVLSGAISLPGNNYGGGNATYMYIVFMEENLFPVSVSSPTVFQIAALNEGSLIYLDRLYVVFDMPEEVENLDWIKFNNSDYTNTTSNYCQFDLPEEGYVYVAYPNVATQVPAWLADFDLLEEKLSSTALDFRLYRKWYAAGTVILGGASANTLSLTPAVPTANYLVAYKKILPISVSISLQGDSLEGIADIPIVGTKKGGLSFIGFPKSNTGETSIENVLDARGLQYRQIMRLRKGVWESYIPTRDESLNWTPADLERGSGYLITSTIEEDQILEIPYVD